MSATVRDPQRIATCTKSGHIYCPSCAVSLIPEVVDVHMDDLNSALDGELCEGCGAVYKQERVPYDHRGRMLTAGQFRTAYRPSSPRST